jgi:hypothetical protein
MRSLTHDELLNNGMDCGLQVIYAAASSSGVGPFGDGGAHASETLVKQSLAAILRHKIVKSEIVPLEVIVRRQVARKVSSPSCIRAGSPEHSQSVLPSEPVRIDSCKNMHGVS